MFVIDINTISESKYNIHTLYMSVYHRNVSHAGSVHKCTYIYAYVFVCKFIYRRDTILSPDQHEFYVTSNIFLMIARFIWYLYQLDGMTGRYGMIERGFGMQAFGTDALTSGERRYEMFRNVWRLENNYLKVCH